MNEITRRKARKMKAEDSLGGHPQLGGWEQEDRDLEKLEQPRSRELETFLFPLPTPLGASVWAGHRWLKGCPYACPISPPKLPRQHSPLR